MASGGSLSIATDGGGEGYPAGMEEGNGDGNGKSVDNGNGTSDGSGIIEGEIDGRAALKAATMVMAKVY